MRRGTVIMDWYFSDYSWPKQAAPAELLLLADKAAIDFLAYFYECQIGNFVIEAISSEGSAS